MNRDGTPGVRIEKQPSIVTEAMKIAEEPIWSALANHRTVDRTTIRSIAFERDGGRSHHSLNPKPVKPTRGTLQIDLENGQEWAYRVRNASGNIDGTG